MRPEAKDRRALRPPSDSRQGQEGPSPRAAQELDPAHTCLRRLASSSVRMEVCRCKPGGLGYVGTAAQDASRSPSGL